MPGDTTGRCIAPIDRTLRLFAAERKLSAKKLPEKRVNYCYYQNVLRKLSLVTTPRFRLKISAPLARLLLGALCVAGTGVTAQLASGQPLAPKADQARTVVRDGQLMSYVAVLDPGAAAMTQAGRAVRAAGGVVIQTWPQIGVLISHARTAAFRQDLLAEPGSGIRAVGASRTATVTEGSPVSAQAKRGPQFTESLGLASKAIDPLEKPQWNMQQIKAPQAQQISDGSSKVLVGVLDSGIEATHPDLAANLDPAASVSCVSAGRPDQSPAAAGPTNSNHGTHVAGVIAAARNGQGIVGVAPKVRIASVKVVNDQGFIYPEYAICGFMWSGIKKMNITNNSYYIDPWLYWCDDQPDQHAVAWAVRRAISWSRSQGVLSVAAAGNGSTDLAHKTIDASSPNDSKATTRILNNNCHDIPAEVPGVIAVSSTTRFEELSYFSNYGLGIVDLTAPGSDIVSTVLGGRYASLSGTSMASPHVSGVAALLASNHPTATPGSLGWMLRNQARDLACPSERCTGPAQRNSYFGEGVANAQRAVAP